MHPGCVLDATRYWLLDSAGLAGSGPRRGVRVVSALIFRVFRGQLIGRLFVFFVTFCSRRSTPWRRLVPTRAQQDSARV
jgi:hypothetical protein